jgi:predicted phosphodiesterase
MPAQSKKCPSCKIAMIAARAHSCLTCRRRVERETRDRRAKELQQVREDARRAADQEHHEHLKRLAANRLTDMDQLKRDHTNLSEQLTQARDVIKRYESAARFENRLLLEVKEMIASNPYRPQFKPYQPSTKTGKGSEHEFLAVVSDAHYAEVVDPAQTFGLKYDTTIAKKRIEHLRDAVIRYGDLRRSAYPIRKLTVNVNGDMISGDIHDELKATNDIPITESMVQMAYILYDMGLAFAQHFPSVEFVIIPGNHPRVTQKPQYKQRWNNWEWVLGKFVQALARDAFDVTVPKDLVYRHKIFGYTVGLSHGDGVKAQSFAGIPHYAMEKRRTKLQSLLKQVKADQLDLLVYGHFHQLIYDEGQGCSLLINGSIKGGDEFSTGTTYSAQTPVQALLTFHAKHGITDLSRINLGHIT